MLTLRCTQKLLTRMRKTPQADPPASTAVRAVQVSEPRRDDPRVDARRISVQLTIR
jgi:hypothetical protein